MKKYKRKISQAPSLKSIQTQFQLASGPQNLRHGGTLRSKRHGRGQRPLSCKDSLHVVFKINRIVLKTQSFRTHQNFQLSREIIQKYADRFFVKIEQISIQGDHIHCLVRTTRRSFFHHFFRVASGQIAQQFEKTDKLRFVVDDRTFVVGLSELFRQEMKAYEVATLLPLAEAAMTLHWRVQLNEAGKCVQFNGIEVPAGSLRCLTDGTELISSPALARSCPKSRAGSVASSTMAPACASCWASPSTASTVVTTELGR